jgi:uncharacterized protein (DUF1810 family)
MSDPFNLARFAVAQEPAYTRVLAELAAGKKHSHWIWYIFPQLRTLGHSETARHFGIASRAEAQAYLAHPVLGTRLLECTGLMLAVADKPLSHILPFPDDLKFISSMTLFEAVAVDSSPFAAAIDRYAAGRRDPATLAATCFS